MSFHLFHITEIYSNADGSVQFIELASEALGQEFWTGHTLTVKQGTTTHSFTIPTNLPGATPVGKTVLLATSGFNALGLAVTADYVVPDGFLFMTGATVNWGSGADTLIYTSLPTDGVLSLGDNGVTTAVNSPRNFSGVTGTVSAGNAAAVAANPVADQVAGAGEAFTLLLPANTFTDANSDTLTYSATLASDAALPAWLAFVSGTRTFSGTPVGGDTGTLSVKVSVTDGNGGSASDIFDLKVISGDVVTGTAGDDSLPGTVNDDLISGLGGNDTLAGGAGNDTISGGDGNDTLVSPATVAALPADVENILLAGTGAIGATGNAAANVITGNSGDNVLDGAGGADTMIGGDGNDTLRSTARATWRRRPRTRAPTSCSRRSAWLRSPRTSRT